MKIFSGGSVECMRHCHLSLNNFIEDIVNIKNEYQVSKTVAAHLEIVLFDRYGEKAYAITNLGYVVCEYGEWSFA